jgi:hypothetical protein
LQSAILLVGHRLPWEPDVAILRIRHCYFRWPVFEVAGVAANLGGAATGNRRVAATDGARWRRLVDGAADGARR